jgi:hypothetical protein
MSFSSIIAYTASDLLGLDVGQLVEYLESNSCVDGGFDISKATGLESLSSEERHNLGSRLR